MFDWLPDPALDALLRYALGVAQYTPGAEIRFGFDRAGPWLYAGLVAAALGAAWYAGGESRRARRARRLGPKLFVLRFAWLALALLCLAGPRLTLETSEPVPQVSALLVDASLSMTMVDDAGEARHAQAARLLDRLQQAASTPGARTSVQTFAFATAARPATAIEQIRFDAPHTSLADSLDGLAEQVRGGLLSSVVVFTDGAFELTAADRRALHRLRSLGVVVHAAPAGSGRSGPDLAISRLVVPRRVHAGGSAQVEVHLRHGGSAPGARAPAALTGLQTRVHLELDGRAIASRAVKLSARGYERVVFSVPFTQGGAKRVQVRAEPLAAERNTRNNIDSAMVRVLSEPVRVLHIEGEPRFEVKFLRRAVHDDPNISIGTVIRTAGNKFYRLGAAPVGDEKNGLPLDAATLYAHDVLIIGSVPADMLPPPLPELIAGFAAERGGGVMFLGGRHAFAEGGMSDPRLLAMLPVEPGPVRADQRALLRVALTPAGELHGVARLAAGGPAMLPAAELPMLSVVNTSMVQGSRVKPGAALLWQGLPAAGGGALPVLSEQRYGRGHVAVLAVRDLWRWQMHKDIPLTDQTHEFFWRQWLRWMARDARAPLHIEVDRRQVAPGQSVRVYATALNKAFAADPALQPRLTAIAPDGTRQDVALEAAGVAGRWQTDFTPAIDGLHEFELGLEGDELAAATGFVDVQALGRELHSSGRRDTTLAAIAAHGGGRVVNIADGAGLDDLVRGAERERPVINSVALWNAPVVMLTLFALLLMEWLLRRRSALP